MKKWYQKTGWIIVLLLLFFPVGIFLMWKYTDWSKTAKGIISGILVLFAIISFANPSSNTTDVASVQEQTTLEATTEEQSSIQEITSQEETTIEESEPETVSEEETTVEEPSTVDNVEEKETPEIETPAPTEATQADTSAIAAAVAAQQAADQAAAEQAALTQQAQEQQAVVAPSPTSAGSGDTVWIASSGNGECYHNKAQCGRMKNSTPITKEQAEAMGLTPCKKCY